MNVKVYMACKAKVKTFPNGFSVTSTEGNKVWFDSKGNVSDKSTVLSKNKDKDKK